MRLLEQVVLEMDEAEAIRLADYKGLYHEQAGAEMGISRQTFSRLIQSAHKKVAESLIEGKALVIRNPNASDSESPSA